MKIKDEGEKEQAHLIIRLLLVTSSYLDLPRGAVSGSSFDRRWLTTGEKTTDVEWRPRGGRLQTLRGR